MERTANAIKVSGMKLTNRLVAFVTLIVVCAIFVLFIGGAISFRQLGIDFISHYVDGMVEVIDQEMATEQRDNQYFSRWLPKMLKASDVTSLTIYSDAGILYQYEQIHYQAPTTQQAITRDIPLANNPGFAVKLTFVPPYAEFAYSIGPLSSLSAAILVIVLGLAWGIQWLRRQLYGSEVLEQRGRLILAGRLDEAQHGDTHEWPIPASAALTQLIEELKEARQERSRFDTFIRTNTFLDQLTGAANRVMFDNRLHTLASDDASQGSLILVRVADWEDLLEQQGQEGADALIQGMGSVLSNAIQRFPDAVLARYFASDFAILLVNQAGEEVHPFLSQLTNALNKLSPPDTLDADNWFHMGMTSFGAGERRGRLMDEAERALRAAQLEGHSGWSQFDKDIRRLDKRGSVRWRTLLESVMAGEGPMLYRQPVYARDGKTRLHYELLGRIKDENGKVLKASRFWPGVELVGMDVVFDKATVSRALWWLKTADHIDNYAINVSVHSLCQREFVIWLRDALLQTPRSILNRLLVEVSEGALVAQFDAARPCLRMIAALGCRLVVDQAGRTVVSTHYVKDIQPAYIKLHRSLVRNIHQRPENQLYLRSMLGACEATTTDVLAVGVETDLEWQVVKELGVVGGQGRLLGAEMSPHPAQKKRRRWGKR
ncbi:RNase E specificity factor CsrD [Salinivibrio proteolyticus]|uniref:RNase E specificity factor CsrD n=1 Tax=Salinivibrio proteolyticus TaxID=334715 RepID=A0ABY7LCU4_9GAMM|nr:RNase E specificity factor CsrD [Salinivibrio proteolyticus]WBA15063.1 RNase E specificity factor CsrD [Salinivibrio proteolyticus]